MQYETFHSYLKDMKNNRLISVNNTSLIPGHAYLIYSINTTHEQGRKYRNFVQITLGYYNPEPKIDDYEDYEDEPTKIIRLTDAFELSYMVSGKNPNIQPADDIENKRLNPTITTHEDIDIQLESNDYDEDISVTIYKIPIPPLKKERVPGIKEEIDELKYFPEKINISFVGSKYKKSKRRFEKSQRKQKAHKKTKGGTTRKSRKTRKNLHKK